MAQVDKSFRPLARSKGSERLRALSCWCSLCFRPLSGIKVSERYLDGFLSDYIDVSVPSRELRYLNES